MTAEIEPQVITDPARATLEQVADLLIPASDRMPSASAAGVAGELLDATVRIRPDLWRRSQPVLAACDDHDPKAVLADIQANDVRAFDALCELVAGAYFMNPRVRELVGYNGQESSTSLMEMSEFMDLIVPVVERGPIYREAPDEPTPPPAP